MLTFGNNGADHWAGEGAKIHCLGEFAGNFNSWVDAAATIVQKRLLAVMSLRQRNAKKKVSLSVVKPNELDEAIESVDPLLIRC